MTTGRSGGVWSDLVLSWPGHGLSSSPVDNQGMKNLRPETMDILKRVETLSGYPLGIQAG
jgi:hypothetical protein